MPRNNFSQEDTGGLSGEITIDFPWPSVEVHIMNDSSDKNLSWKIKDGHSWMTLRPAEAVSLTIHITQIVLYSTGAPYRVWVLS